MTKKELLKNIISESEHKFLGVYENLGIKFLKFKCNDCSHEFIVDIDTLIEDNEVYCSKCYDVYPKRKTLDIHWPAKIFDLHSGSIEYIERPSIGTDLVMTRCNKCGHTWKRRANSKKGCPKCNVMATKSNEWFSEEMEKLHPNLKVYGNYSGYKTVMKVMCTVCNREYSCTAGNLLSGFGCKKCGYKKSSEITKVVNGNLAESTIQEREIKFLKTYKDKFEDKFELECDFKNSRSYAKLKCRKCGRIKHIRVRELMNLTTNTCIGCESYNKSYSADELYEYILSYVRCVKGEWFSFYENEKYLCKRELDIYIPELKLGIEYDGLYWHSDEKKNKNYHVEKQALFNSIGIRTIFIREDEWKHKREIVESRIKNLIGISENRIYARKCDIREVSNSVKNLFLDKYHIQGKDSSSIKYGLYYKGKLVSLITFSKSRYSVSGSNDTDSTYELVRFCSRTNINVVGGFSKLLKYCEVLLKQLGCKEIKTFADKRWSVGNVYEKCGFTLSHETNAGYCYYKGDNTYNRIGFQKHKLREKLDVFDESLTEEQNMYNNGYGRIYDCGQLVYYKEI